MSEQKLPRRAVLKGAFMSLAAIPVVVAMKDAGAATAATPAKAPAGLPLVDPAKDPMAKGLGYVADAATVKDPAKKPGAHCANCALYTGKPGEKQGGCGIFAGKAVLAAGWCKSWVKKP